MTKTFEAYTDENGIDYAPCHICGTTVCTHPEAGNTLEYCGDCGKVTCLEHREEGGASRCTNCQSIYNWAD